MLLAKQKNATHNYTRPPALKMQQHLIVEMLINRLLQLDGVLPCKRNAAQAVRTTAEPRRCVCIAKDPGSHTVQVAVWRRAAEARSPPETGRGGNGALWE